ncbi:Gamma-butyrobetaine dioxygenase [Lachnellula arida]|uniref:Gamma-butyrobetaine dioxygenase n=1 Tax=Lachnellula arida TaxID=1316785 RepID=A0A8T9BJ92_9HELO|nr:Gamma-butyrobetaine dioxygenase [Lachnellula arida]
MALPILRSSILGATKRRGTCRRIEAFNCQSRGYAQTFSSPLDGFEDASLSMQQQLTYRQRRKKTAKALQTRLVPEAQKDGPWRLHRQPRGKFRRVALRDGPQLSRNPLLPGSPSLAEDSQTTKSPVLPLNGLLGPKNGPRRLVFRSVGRPSTPLGVHLGIFRPLRRVFRKRRGVHHPLAGLLKSSGKPLLPESPSLAEDIQTTEPPVSPLNGVLEPKETPLPVKKHALGPRSNSTVQIGKAKFHPVLLRDACMCSKCVDPHSTQKNFQTPEIPPNIEARSLETSANGDIHIKWGNDIPGFGDDHVSIFPSGSLNVHDTIKSMNRDRTQEMDNLLWNTNRIKKELQFVNFQDYMTSDKCLLRASFLLLRQGLLIIRGVPESENSVEDIALRIGPIRDSFYGRTWDVKSVPDAKNVAYTAQFLGLHMDLLYMANPPGFQLLHCLKSTAKGGESLFADAFSAARALSDKDRAILERTPVAYQYQNAGEHYYHTHPVIEAKSSQNGKPVITNVNYSPPFQANYLLPTTTNEAEVVEFLKAFKAFTHSVEDTNHLFQYRLQEGECVIFNNRRILHGRRQFDALGGERWLKGAYVDSDVVRSRFRAFSKEFPSTVWGGNDDAQFVFTRAKRAHYVKRWVKKVRRESSDDGTLVRKVNVNGGLVRKLNFDGKLLRKVAVDNLVRKHTSMTSRL